MLPNKLLCSIPHGSRIEFISTVVHMEPLKWIHDGVVVNSVIVNLACDGKAGVKFRWDGSHLSDSDIGREKTI